MVHPLSSLLKKGQTVNLRTLKSIQQKTYWNWPPSILRQQHLHYHALHCNNWSIPMRGLTKLDTVSSKLQRARKEQYCGWVTLPKRHEKCLPGFWTRASRSELGFLDLTTLPQVWGAARTDCSWSLVLIIHFSDHREDSFADALGWQDSCPEWKERGAVKDTCRCTLLLTYNR